MSTATLAFPAFEVWGLTGGIASGKSTVARMLEDEGLPVIDADRVARELSQPGGAAHPAILARFGTDDRARLRQIVFADSEARRDLEGILHSLIQAESLRRMETIAAQRAAAPGPKVRVVYEAALLVETGRYRNLSGLIVVDCPRELRRSRLIERDQVDPELADRMLSAQIADEERLRAATHVIRNEGSLTELKASVHVLVARLGWR